MPYATNGDVRLYWDTKGSGSPVLLVMGASYSSRMWYPVIDTVAEKHRAIWFDNRGIGRSQEVRTGSIEDMAADAVAVLDAAGVEEAHVYGVSLGGVVALQLALQSPERVRSLVLGCTGILSEEKRRAPRLLNALYRLPAGARWSLVKLLGSGSYGSAAPPDSIAKDLTVLREDRATYAGLVQQQDALRAYSVRKQVIQGLEFPALVLHGTEDKLVPLAFGQELADALPHATLVTFNGAGHNYLVAYPERANAEVMRFMADVDNSNDVAQRLSGSDR